MVDRVALSTKRVHDRDRVPFKPVGVPLGATIVGCQAGGGKPREFTQLKEWICLGLSKRLVPWLDRISLGGVPASSQQHDGQEGNKWCHWTALGL